MSPPPRFAVGIDLGTSNCALAAADLSTKGRPAVRDFDIVQSVRPGEVAARTLLPSCVYVPGADELPPGSLSLPWGEGAQLVGEGARWQGARVPFRLISSAKSWLCHDGVDRLAPILPWGAPADVTRKSPVDAQAALLSHMRLAWNHAHPDAPLEAQEVVLTIPASFDEGARGLTLTAAERAGFNASHLRLLEEPQAAFYDFVRRQTYGPAEALKNVRLVLVVDVGGGTTDFSLMQVSQGDEGPVLERVAVGEHLLLGGDNMDAAVAHHAEDLLATTGKSWPQSQWQEALLAARAVKETLLSGRAPASTALAVAAGGSKLLGSTLSVELSRDDLRKRLCDGFFPEVSSDSLPATSSRPALAEWGLPFVSDAAITRHAVAFLRAHAAAGAKALGISAQDSALPRPDAVLLNGGVFNSAFLVETLMARLSALWPKSPALTLLKHDSLDLAVARGASYSAVARLRDGLRIRGGAARSYFVAATTDAGLAGVCVLPRGTEEDRPVRLASLPLQVALGQPVQFRLYASTADRVDVPGAIVSLDERDLKALPPLHAVLDGTRGAFLPVELEASLSSIGTLTLSAVSAAQRYRLEFELKGEATSEGAVRLEPLPARFQEALDAVERVYGKAPLPVEARDIKQLPKVLESILGARDHWHLPMLRELWTALFAGAPRRRRSADHERIFFHLLGYAMRPGFGYPLDSWRAAQTFTLFKDLVTHHTEEPVWAEFWVSLRRCSAGLDEAAQRALLAYLMPPLERRLGPSTPPVKEKGIVPKATEEMVRLASSLEKASPLEKERLGALLLGRLRTLEARGGPWAWALGRLGARQGLQSSGHLAVTAEVAQAWAEALLSKDLLTFEGALFAVARLAQMTGDRTRDVSPEFRARVASSLLASGAPASWLKLVTEVSVLSDDDRARAVGDSLPAGLVLRAR